MNNSNAMDLMTAVLELRLAVSDGDGHLDK